MKRPIAVALTFGFVLFSVAEAGKKKPEPTPPSPPTVEEIDASLRRGVEFLLARQESNGAWGSPRRTKDLNIFAPVPGAHHAFRAAVTSLCVSALIETGGDDPRVDAALDRAEAWMFEHLPNLKRATPKAIYNNWGHAYSIQALTRMLQRNPHDDDAKNAARREQILDLIRLQIKRLERYECVDGGWCYYDFNAHTQQPSGSSISFVTSTVLVALKEAQAAGVEVPQRIVDRGMASILRQRIPGFTYAYGEYVKLAPMRGINRTAGSLGRSQACNVAMRLWGDERVTDEVLDLWLRKLFARNFWLDIGRKRPVPHESWAQVAGYFFYYGHYYGALCIEQLPEDRRGPHQQEMAALLLALQEKDGSWWDYPLYDYHQQYGTALALMSLSRSRP